MYYQTVRSDGSDMTNTDVHDDSVLQSKKRDVHIKMYRQCMNVGIAPIDVSTEDGDDSFDDDDNIDNVLTLTQQRLSKH